MGTTVPVLWSDSFIKRVSRLGRGKGFKRTYISRSVLKLAGDETYNSSNCNRDIEIPQSVSDALVVRDGDRIFADQCSLAQPVQRLFCGKSREKRTITTPRRWP